MKKPDFSALTQRECAAALGVDERTVRRWSDEDDPVPRNGDYTYNLPLVIAWWHARESGSGLDLNAERARLAKEQADKTALDNEQRRGRLLSADQVELAWSNHIANARARLLSMPPKLGPQLTNVADPNIIATRIRAEVNAALWELVIDDQPAAAADQSDPDMEAAAGIDDQPVGGHEPKVKQRKQRGAGSLAD